MTKDLTLRRIRARLDRDFGEGTVPGPRGGAAYRALDELSCGRGSFGSSAKGGAHRRAPVGDLRAAACVTAWRVRADGQHQAGCVRDGAGHAALGAGRADDRDGPVHQVHPRASGDARVDEECRRRLGAVRGAQPARGSGGLAAGGGLALSRGARDAGRGRGHGAGAAVFRARPAARHSRGGPRQRLSVRSCHQRVRPAGDLGPACPSLHADRQIAGRALLPDAR